MNSSDDSIPFFDVVVIGAGPAGAEAALASAAGGSHTLCLAISLDTIGYPPGWPAMVADPQDVRGRLLEEMEIIGGLLPALVRRQEIAVERTREHGFAGRVVIDRRRLGLAYKEALESANRLELRQALVTSVEPHAARKDKAAWRITGNLGEKFDAAGVVVATGTFLRGEVDDAGEPAPGGRRGEIPANALALGLQKLGLEMVEIKAAADPRVDGRQVRLNLTQVSAGKVSDSAPGDDLDGANVAKNDNVFIADGCQLGELLAGELKPEGNRLTQLSVIRERTGLPGAWMTRAAYTIRHLVLRAGQVNGDLESPQHPGLFFAGRAAGSCNYVEAALLGTLAGANASAGTQRRDFLIKRTKYSEILCSAISNQDKRPVTVCST